MKQKELFTACRDEYREQGNEEQFWNLIQPLVRVACEVGGSKGYLLYAFASERAKGLLSEEERLNLINCNRHFSNIYTSLVEFNNVCSNNTTT